jgi:CheY-like chemotaxis protein
LSAEATAIDGETSLCPRILLIDDDPTTLRTIELILLDLGHHVQTALDGEQGLELFPKPFDADQLADLVTSLLPGAP